MSPPGRARRGPKWLGACWLMLAPLLVLALLRVVAHDRTFALIAANSFSFWLYLPAWPLLLVAAYGKRFRLATAALLLVVLHVYWIGPRGLVAAPLPPLAANAARFRVMSVNLFGSNTDTESIAAEVLGAHPDVLLLQELTPHWQARFERSDMLQALPHRRFVTRSDNFGIGLLTRDPQVTEQLDLIGVPALRADVQVGRERVRVYNFHTMPPVPGAVETWNEMMARVESLVVAERGPTLLGGDFNTTPHHAWFQRLLAAGLRGAHEERGRALATTWPNGGLALLPPIRLDHLFVSRHIVVLAVTEGEGRGSDHRPVIGDFALVP